MAIQIVMDHTGDSRHTFEPRDAEAVAKAESRFKALTRKGFTAGRTAAGESRRITAFDPNIEQTLFFPRLAGG